MKKIALIFLISICFCSNTYAEEPGKEPEVSASSAILMDCKTGRILWGKNETAPLSNASTTKILTAILAIEEGNLQDEVTVSGKAASSPEVKMFLRKGEKIKLEYLLYALMLQSSNDAAVAIAEHVGGSVEGFCARMTERARELGATDTLFETPNGLDTENHHSTAQDLAIMTRYALNNEEFVKIINTPSISVQSNRTSYSIVNKNRLLSEYNGANGVKTGFTGKAGHCFVGAAQRDGMQLISVVLASGWGNKGKEDKWRDTKKILDYGFKNYKYHQIATSGDVTGEIFVDRSKTDRIQVCFRSGLELPLTATEKDSLKIQVKLPDVIKAPVAREQSVGVANIYLSGEIYQSIDLITAESAERHDLKTSLEQSIGSWLEMGTTGKVEVVLPEF